MSVDCIRYSREKLEQNTCMIQMDNRAENMKMKKNMRGHIRLAIIVPFDVGSVLKISSLIDGIC